MSRDNATPGMTVATKRVLGEIAEILEDYPKAVVVGGFVPYLLVPQENEAHEGTIDIDIVLDLDQPGASDVYTLHETLERRMFVQDEKRPFRYVKSVYVGDEHYEVLVELLAGGDPPPGGLRLIRTEDVYVSIIKGIEVALDQSVKVQLPDVPNLRLSVASLPASLTMKAVALEQRVETKKTKDAYDIVYCLRNFPGGAEAIAKEFTAYSSNPIVSSGITLLKELFASTESVGPIAYARATDNFEDAALMRREAYERVNILVQLIEDQVLSKTRPKQHPDN